MNITLQLQGQLASPEQMKAASQSMVLGVQLLEMGSSPGSSPARFRATVLYRLRV